MSESKTTLESKDIAEQASAIEAYQSFDIKSTPLPQTAMGWFREGFLTPILGLKMLFKIKGLFWYFMIPVVIQSVISLALLGLFYLLGSLLEGWITSLVDWTTQKITELAGAENIGDLSGWIELLLKIAIWAPLILFFLYMFVIAWRITGGVLTGYFGGRLTDKALQASGIELTQAQETTFFGELLRSWSHAGMIAVPSTLAIGALELVPLVGTLVAVPLVWSYAAFMTGYEELRDPLEKMGFTKLAALRTSWRCRAATFGLGLAKLTSEPVPIVGGIVQAAESLGRISLATRMVRSQGAEESDSTEPDTLVSTPTDSD